MSLYNLIYLCVLNLLGVENEYHRIHWAYIKALFSRLFGGLCLMQIDFPFSNSLNVLWLFAEYSNLPVVINAPQRTLPSESGQINMVLDNHDITNVVTLIQPSSSVSNDEGLDTKVGHDTHRKSDL